MNNTNLFEEFEERSLEALMGYKDSFLDFTSLENRGIVNMQETTSSRTMLGETIRGMNNVSPLATVKFLIRLLKKFLVNIFRMAMIY